MQRRNFVTGCLSAAAAAIASLFPGRPVQAKPETFTDPRRGSEIKWPENHRSCEWVEYAEQDPPEEDIYLVCYRNNGHLVYSTAHYIPYRTVLAEDFIDPDCRPDFVDRDEETDTEWAPEGFYEFPGADDFQEYLGVTGFDYRTKKMEPRLIWWMKTPKPPAKLKAAIDEVA